jgi:small GTP-binding protein
VHALDQNPLLAALDELSALAGEQASGVLDDLRDRLREQRLRVLVAGEAKRGKSTLVNALLGRAVLPMGVVPLTALPTTVRHGRDEGVRVVFRDGRSERLPLGALEDLVTERGNPGNRRHVATVAVTVDAPVLARGVEIVDTPGTGSVHEHNTAEAEAALDTMDAAVVVLTADPPVSASERDLIARVADLSVTMFVVLNKADYLDGDAADGSGPGGSDLAEAVKFTARVAGAAAERAVRVYPVSARAALTAGSDPGFAAFASDFTAYLDTERAADLELSVTAHARRVAGALQDEAELARRAAQMRTGDAAGRVAAFSDRLAAVTGHSRDAAGLAAAESARMLTELNEAAGSAAAELTAAVRAQLDAFIDGELRSAPAGQIERRGRDRLTDLAVEAAESWRRDQRSILEQGLGRLDARLAADLRSELDAVRDAAAQLLGLDLTVPGPGDRLRPDLRFFYNVTEDAGQTELLAGAIRRRIPGEWGRRTARAHLDRELAHLVPQQIGRARADLQYRLAEATRQLIRDAGHRYSESTGRLASALRTAADLREATARDAERGERELAERGQALRRVLALLDSVTAGMATAAARQIRP